MMHNREREKTVEQIEGERQKVRRQKVSNTTSRMKERRIRLSANTAIQFYDVQDRLGYDRATNAIDWLMKEAKVAIDALDDANQQAVHGRCRVPATTTIFNPSETFHQTYDQNQQNMNYGQTSSFDNHVFGFINPVNRFPQEMNFFSTSKAPLDFTWNENYERGECCAFVNREPIQSNYACTTKNGVYGYGFQKEIQVQEDENHNLVVVPGPYQD